MRVVRILLVVIVGVYLLAAVLYAIPVVSGALDDSMEVKFDRPDPSIVADYRNGLSQQQRESFYHLSQGAEILPWILLTAVDVADPGSSKPFVENLSRYGLLPDPGRDDGLPVGLTVATNPFTFGADFVGITCAACHVGELHHDGKAVRVDGAPNMFNLQLFYSDAVEALLAVASDHGKLWDMAKRLGRQDWQRYGVAAPFIRPATLVYSGVNVLVHRDRLDARLELIKVIRAAQDQRDKEHPTSGYGRLDAFDGTRNFLFTRLRKADAGATFKVNTDNLVKLDAAVKFPPLWSHKATPPPPFEAYNDQPGSFPRVWGFKDYDWIEWTIDTNTVMERNITETLGAGATVVLDPNLAGSLFDSSIPITNMHSLEWLAYYIDPPRWPEAAFGAVKPDVAVAGATIFHNTCARCHEYGDDRRTSTGLIQLRGMRPDGVGTDATAALRISCPVPDTGALPIKPRSYSADDSQLLKDCKDVTAGTAFEGASFAADGEGRRGWDQAEGLRSGWDQCGTAGRHGRSRPAREGHVARHAARHQGAGRPLCGAAALRDLGGGAVPAQRIGADLVRPAAAPRASAQDIRTRRAPVRPGQARLRRRDVLQPAGLPRRHHADRRRQWRPPLGHRPVRARPHGVAGISQDVLTSSFCGKGPSYSGAPAGRRPGSLSKGLRICGIWIWLM